MYAAACHGDNTFTGNVGAEYVFDEKAIIKRYLALSGGDNGLDEDMIWQDWNGPGLASVADAKGFAKVDIDPTNANQTQSAIYLFGGIQFQLSVPNKWINNFSTGAVWDAPASPNPRNGHGIHFNGVDANGHYKLQTWGTYGWITPAGVAACDPSAVCGRFASVVQLCGLCTKRIALHTASSPLGAARRESVAGEPLPGPGSNAYSNPSRAYSNPHADSSFS